MLKASTLSYYDKKYMSFKDTIKYVYYDERLTYICDKLQTRMRGITIPDFVLNMKKENDSLRMDIST